MKSVLHSPIIIISLLILNIIQLGFTLKNFQLINSYTKEQKTVNAEMKSNINKINPSTTNDTITKNLSELRQEIIRYRAENQNTILGSTSDQVESNNDPLLSLDTSIEQTKQNQENLTLIKLKPKWSSVDVFETPNPSSKITGQIISNQTYITTSKIDHWHQIKLSPSKTAWVHDQFIDEITN